MTDKNSSQVQNPYESLQALQAQQLQSMEKLFAEIDTLESKALEQTNTMVGQLATMARESVNAASRVATTQQTAASSMASSAVPSMNANVDQLHKVRDAQFEQARVGVEELARLSQASLSYATKLSSEWRKLTLETARRSTEWMKPGA